MSIFTGCSTPGALPSRRVISDASGNFHFYISDQSFAISPIDVKVFIDGKLVATGDFEVGSQHSWHEYVLKLSAGHHKIVAESSKGHATLEQAFEVADKAWAVLGYWYYPNNSRGVESCPRQFSFIVKKEPILFQ
jgi:hypothetical protein